MWSNHCGTKTRESHGQQRYTLICTQNSSSSSLTEHACSPCAFLVSSHLSSHDAGTHASARPPSRPHPPLPHVSLSHISSRPVFHAHTSCLTHTERTHALHTHTHITSRTDAYLQSILLRGRRWSSCCTTRHHSSATRYPKTRKT